MFAFRHLSPSSISRRSRFGVLILALISALLAPLLPPIAPAAAQGTTVTETIVSPNSGRTWKVHRDGVEQGTAWRQVGFDDSSWEDTPMRFYEAHGTVVNDGWHAYYFREEFEITDLHQIAELHLDLYYDDAAVLYLNGQEVYRTIRNNLPSTDDIPVNGVIPVDYVVQFGGAEDYYVQIPATSNYCELGCINDGATTAVDVSLLNEGTNVFTAMAWTRPTSDLGFDLAVDVVRDLDAPLPDRVVINEIVASNDTLLDEDGNTPDWFELHNTGTIDVSLAGWTIEDGLTSWAFPAVTLPVDGYLTVFASDKDRAPTNGAPLHTNFKLSKEGDSLRLVDGNQIVRDAWEQLPRQIPDIAWGRALDGDTITYLAATTPGSANSDVSAALPPEVRPFSGRIFNVGDPIQLSVDAFDPEGGALTYSLPNNQSMAIDPATGIITGTATTVGEFVYPLTVRDSAGQSVMRQVPFTVLEEPTGPPSLVLNEYNAVTSTTELSGGSDPAFGPVLGNGGDWFEFVVVEDLLDLRGWTIQLWDRDRADDMLDRAATLTFNQDFRLAALAAGTIITISEDRPDDLSYDPANGDWTLNLQAGDLGVGALFSVQENFNSSRSDQHVEIRDASGVLRSPVLGETEVWDQFNGGVGSGEVMNLCIDPTTVNYPDPQTDFHDNAVASTYGEPNRCSWIDPNDPAGVSVITFDQDLGPLRASAGLRGDVNCDNQVDLLDALRISQHSVGLVTDVGSCPLTDPATQVNLGHGDVNVDTASSLLDALLISQCRVGIASGAICP